MCHVTDTRVRGMGWDGMVHTGHSIGLSTEILDSNPAAAVSNVVQFSSLVIAPFHSDI